MKQISEFLILIGLITIFTASQAIAIKKVPAKLNVLGFHAGFLTPVGKYSGFFNDEFGTKIDADQLYEPSVKIGMKYGQLAKNHLFIGLGFVYTNVAKQDTAFINPNGFSLALYDLEVSLSYYQSDLSLSTLSPYVGISIKPGLYVFSPRIGSSITDLGVSLSLDLGIDLKVWESVSKRSHLVLSSTNSYDFYATADQPKFLSVGAGLKYFYRP